MVCGRKDKAIFLIFGQFEKNHKDLGKRKINDNHR